MDGRSAQAANSQPLDWQLEFADRSLWPSVVIILFKLISHKYRLRSPSELNLHIATATSLMCCKGQLQIYWLKTADVRQRVYIIIWLIRSIMCKHDVIHETGST